MRLDTESLRTLKTTIEVGSLTAASGLLAMTPSAVSWKLKRLEQKVGRKLIHRDGHNIEATADARQLLDYAEVILNAHDEAVQQFRLSDLQGQVRIGVTDDIAVGQFPVFVERFHRRHPAVRLEIRVEQQLALLDWFNDREIDLAILPLEESMLEADDITLWEDELVWVKHRDVEYSLQEPVPLVTFSPSCTYRNAAIQVLQEQGIEYYVSMQCPSLQGVRAIVSSGMGVTLINRGLMAEDHNVWQESAEFSTPRKVNFIIRMTQLLPAQLRDVIVAELKSNLLQNGH